MPSGTDPDFLDSVQQAAADWHPAFRPERWLPHAEPATHTEEAALLDEAVHRSGHPREALGFLPLAAEHPGDWVVLLERSSGEPLDILPLNGWGH